jgi:hypothetical protein
LKRLSRTEIIVAMAVNCLLNEARKFVPLPILPHPAEVADAIPLFENTLPFFSTSTAAPWVLTVRRGEDRLDSGLPEQRNRDAEEQCFQHGMAISGDLGSGVETR